MEGQTWGVPVAEGGGLFDRLERLAVRGPVGPGWLNVFLLGVRAARRFVDVRVTGLAAEMTYYALISLLPLITALGAALGFLQRFVGQQQVQQIETAFVGVLSRVFDEELAGDILAPMVEGLLRQERAGVAIGSLAIALWLAGRMFRAAIRALDDAYVVSERRGLLALLGLGTGLSLLAVVTVLVVLAMVVVGPLLGGGQRLADWMGLGRAFEVLWAVTRWPVVAVICVVFLSVLYRYGPNVRNTWRDCLPGAVVGTAGLVAVAIGFQVYLSVAGPTVPEVAEGGEAVAVAGRMLGAVLAGVLWGWLSSIVVLTGGILNAEVRRLRRDALTGT